MSLSFFPIPSTSLEVKGSNLIYNPNNEIYRNSHIINRNDSDINDLSKTPLYKYFSIENLSYLLKARKLFIDKIEKWDDCYENFFLKCQFSIDGRYVDAKSLIPGIFGQSWTMKQESDAMWRIYSGNKTGVKIKTNALKLFKVLYVDDECMANTWFGNVKYDTMKNFQTYIEGLISKQSSTEVFQFILPETEFMKRTEFDHEGEFRIVVMLDSNQTKQYQQYERLAYNIIDIDNFIEEICLDPRLTDTEFDSQKQQLENLGVDKNKIVKSKLYDFTPFPISLQNSLPIP